MIGFTSVTFRKLSNDKIISLAGECGAQCIEWGGDVHVTNPTIAREVKMSCADSGIAVNSYGSYFRLFDDSNDEFKRQCEIAAELGAQVIRVWAGSKGSARFDDATFIKLIEQSRFCADIAEEYGLKIGTEFHQNTYNDTPESCEGLMMAVSRNNFRTYWQPRYYGNDMKRLEAMLHYTINAHIFYWDLFGKRKRLLSQGRSAVEGFVKKLQNSGFNGDYILEFVRDDSIENFRSDMKTLLEICG